MTIESQASSQCRRAGRKLQVERLEVARSQGCKHQIVLYKFKTCRAASCGLLGCRPQGCKAASCEAAGRLQGCRLQVVRLQAAMLQATGCALQDCKPQARVAEQKCDILRRFDNMQNRIHLSHANPLQQSESAILLHFRITKSSRSVVNQ